MELEQHGEVLQKERVLVRVIEETKRRLEKCGSLHMARKLECQFMKGFTENSVWLPTTQMRGESSSCAEQDKSQVSVVRVRLADSVSLLPRQSMIATVTLTPIV